jgi:hypothetical protein
MVTDFDDTGHLQPGIYSAMLDEFDGWFGQASVFRPLQMESVRGMPPKRRHSRACPLEPASTSCGVRTSISLKRIK